MIVELICVIFAVRAIAEGTFGAVWEGRWGGQVVAIKILKSSDMDPESVEDFHKVLSPPSTKHLLFHSFMS